MKGCGGVVFCCVLFLASQVTFGLGYVIIETEAGNINDTCSPTSKCTAPRTQCKPDVVSTTSAAETSKTTEIPTIPTSVSTKPPTVPTKPPTVPTKPPTVPTKPPTVPTKPPTVPTKPPTVPTKPPTVPTKPPTVPTKPPTVPTKSTINQKKPVREKKSIWLSRDYYKVDGSTSHCVCTDDSTLSPNGTKCLINGKLNEACLYDEDCEKLNAICLTMKNGTMVCGCGNDSLPSINGNKCLKKLHSKCNADEDCLNNKITTTCTADNSADGKTCQCKANYTEDHGKCPAPYGKPCTVADNCQDQHAVCVKSANSTVPSCQCKEKYKYKSGKCSAGSIASLALGALLLSQITRLML